MSHKLPNHSYGHALILFDGSGYMLEQAEHVYQRIESLVKSLDLKLEDDKERAPRPKEVFGKLVLFQAEVLCTYNGVIPGEMSATRGDILNVYGMDGPHYKCELKGADGMFPIGLSKKVAGSEAGVPQDIIRREEAKAFKPGEQALSPNYGTAHPLPPNYISAAATRPSFGSSEFSASSRGGGGSGSASPQQPRSATLTPTSANRVTSSPSLLAGAATVSSASASSSSNSYAPSNGGGGGGGGGAVPAGVMARPGGNPQPQQQQQPTMMGGGASRRPVSQIGGAPLVVAPSSSPQPARYQSQPTHLTSNNDEPIPGKFYFWKHFVEKIEHAI